MKPAQKHIANTRETHHPTTLLTEHSLPHLTLHTEFSSLALAWLITQEHSITPQAAISGTPESYLPISSHLLYPATACIIHLFQQENFGTLRLTVVLLHTCLVLAISRAGTPLLLLDSLEAVSKLTPCF